jgi:hypothetical protein
MEPAGDLDQLLARKRSFSARAAATLGMAEHLRELRTWQIERLARTYDDMLRDSRYSRAVQFFLTDLYGQRDSAARDRELARASRYLRPTLPAAALAALEYAIALEVLNADLDQAMIAALSAWPLTSDGYAVAYRAVGRREARQRQIELVVAIGESLDGTVRSEWVGAALRLARAPAYAAGFRTLQDFLERGHAAFASMTDPRPLLEAIRERETRVVNDLFAV